MKIREKKGAARGLTIEADLSTFDFDIFEFWSKF